MKLSLPKLVRLPRTLESGMKWWVHDFVIGTRSCTGEEPLGTFWTEKYTVDIESLRTSNVTLS